MRALIAKQPQVLQRIAVDDDGVGEGAGLNDPSLPAAPHLGADDGRRRMISMGETTSERKGNSRD